MPALKVLHSLPFNEAMGTLASDLEEIVLRGLEATGERAEIVLAPADLVRYGTGAYVELVCRNRPGRTADRMKALAAELHARLAIALDATDPRIRIRILLIDDDHAYGIN